MKLDISFLGFLLCNENHASTTIRRWEKGELSCYFNIFTFCKRTYPENVLVFSLYIPSHTKILFHSVSSTQILKLSFTQNQLFSLLFHKRLRNKSHRLLQFVGTVQLPIRSEGQPSGPSDARQVAVNIHIKLSWVL